MLGTFITFPADFASSTMAYAGGLVSDFSTPLTLILGVLLAGILVVLLIRALTR